MLVDYHVHSEFSDDSTYPMEEVVLDAIDKGLDEICFTDHVDYGVKKDHDDHPLHVNGRFLANVDYERYFPLIEKLQAKYGDKIRIKKGLEYGIQVHTIKEYNDLFAKYPLDFAILSVHQVDDKEFFLEDYQKGKSQKEYNEGYYKEIYNVAKNFKNYSVLGHLDHIVRYDRLGPYPFDKIKDLVAEILKVAIKDEKGIELNTSFHRYALKDSTPSKDILLLYKDLGGRIITIGSDSHKKEHLGAYIKEGFSYLKELGFKEYCTFDKMQAIFHEL